jgi:NAD(P)-dependent dehydrogenase (short-subunit alcohol dehydrogenase family)
MASFLVTGSARGIGSELIRQLAAKPDSEVNVVFATSRAENDRLKELAEQYPGRVIFVPLTVGDETSMRNAVPIVEAALKDKGLSGLDVLINNAGIVGWNHAKEMYDYRMSIS